jgi:hypothetical protein
MGCAAPAAGAGSGPSTAATATPVLDYRCAACGRVYNAWTGAELQCTQRRPGELVLITRGIAQGTPTA